MNSVSNFLEKHPERVDSERIFYYGMSLSLSDITISQQGGSHGGFIGGHMSARDKRIKASVLYNPVLDISTMVGTTDIPDWYIYIYMLLIIIIII